MSFWFSSYQEFAVYLSWVVCHFSLSFQYPWILPPICRQQKCFRKCLTTATNQLPVQFTPLLRSPTDSIPPTSIAGTTRPAMDPLPIITVNVVSSSFVHTNCNVKWCFRVTHLISQLTVRHNGSSAIIRRNISLAIWIIHSFVGLYISKSTVQGRKISFLMIFRRLRRYEFIQVACFFYKPHLQLAKI